MFCAKVRTVETLLGKAPENIDQNFGRVSATAKWLWRVADFDFML